MCLNDLKKMFKHGWESSWDCHDHNQEVHRNNPISLDWFLEARANNPVVRPPNFNPDEIDDLIAHYRREWA